MSSRQKNATKPNRRKAIAIYVVLFLYIFIVIALIVLTNGSSLGVRQGSTDGNFGIVLGDIENITTKNPRIVDIAMLGSHDSNSDKIEFNSPFDKSEEGSVLDIVQPLSRGLQHRFSITQKVGVYQQLMQGARWLHLNYTNYHGVWYGTHSRLSAKLESYILEIVQFLSEHTGEVVLIVFQPTYLGDETYASFHDWLTTVKYEGKNLYDFVHYGDDNDTNSSAEIAINEPNTFEETLVNKPNTFSDTPVNGTNSSAEIAVNGLNSSVGEAVNIWDLRYNNVTNSGHSAGLVLFDRREGKKYSFSQEGNSVLSKLFFDLDSNCIHTWHNRTSPKAVIEKINKTEQNIAENMHFYKSFLRVNQTQVTFSAVNFNDMLSGIFGWSLLKIASKHNIALLENENFDKWLTAMPIFQVDFVNSDYGDFNHRANAKIRTYNEKLCINDKSKF